MFIFFYYESNVFHFVWATPLDFHIINWIYFISMGNCGGLIYFFFVSKQWDFYSSFKQKLHYP